MSEEEIFQQLLPLFARACEMHHLDVTAFNRREYKEFSTIYYDKNILFRLRRRGHKDYISFPLDENRQIPFPSSDCFAPEWEPLILNAIEDMVDNAGKEYDCCASFEACSDIGMCVREDNLKDSIYCGYRKVLKSGRIFFGKRRNM